MTTQHNRTYILDTSVLLADPGAIDRFEEHAIVLPIVVLDELERKRHHPDLGWAARTALRRLEGLREVHGELQHPLPINDLGGTVRVELNHRDGGHLPDALRGESNDHRILAVAAALQAEGHEVVMVSKDLPLRLRAGLVGLHAEDLRSTDLSVHNWTGLHEIDVTGADLDGLFGDGSVDIDASTPTGVDATVGDIPINAGAILRHGSSTGLARRRANKRFHIVRGDRSVFGVTGRSAPQRFALDLLVDDSVGIVSLGGAAGTGKSVLALAAGLHATIDLGTYRRVVVFRPIYPVGGQDLGYLPGSEAEKMSPWGDAVHDALDAIAPASTVDHVRSEGLVEVLPLTHLRGRTFTDTFIVIDEAQNLERTVLLTALSRVGENSRVVLTHDVAQRDNLRVGRNDGVMTVINDLVGHPLFGHVTLTRSERSPTAALIASLAEAG